MEDFDANIEDQKEDNKKDAEEEESELVGNMSADPSNYCLLLQCLIRILYVLNSTLFLHNIICLSHHHIQHNKSLDVYILLFQNF